MKRILTYLALSAATLGPAQADILRIDDLTDTLTASLKFDNPKEIGSIGAPATSTVPCPTSGALCGELLGVVYTFPVGFTPQYSQSTWRQMINPEHSDDVSGTVSDILWADWVVQTSEVRIVFASDLDNGLPPKNFMDGVQLPNILEDGTFQDLINVSAVNSKGDIVSLQIDVASDVPEPSTWALFALGAAGVLVGSRRRLAPA